jgi:FkbM family methyltransferase
VPRSPFQTIKTLAERFHALVARSSFVTRCYLGLWALVLRRFPESAAKHHVVNSLALAPWPALRLEVTSTTIAGATAALRLVPHPGMLDFRAMFYRSFEYEPEAIRFLETHLSRVDNVIEIGANVGLYTLFFSQHLARRGAGRVYAFEPSPRTYSALLDNLLANQTENVSALNAAVFSEAGLAMFYEPTVAASGDRALVRSSLIERHARWDAREVRQYPVFTVGPAHLEPLLKNGGHVLIKLDIEGAEVHVLRALQPLLLQHRPDIMLEVLLGECASLNTLDFLLQGYRLFHLTDQGPVEHPRFLGDPQYRFRDYFLTAR